MNDDIQAEYDLDKARPGMLAERHAKGVRTHIINGPAVIHRHVNVPGFPLVDTDDARIHRRSLDPTDPTGGPVRTV